MKAKFDKIDWFIPTRGGKVFGPYYYHQFGGTTANRQILYKIQYFFPKATRRFRTMKVPTIVSKVINNG